MLLLSKLLSALIHFGALTIIDPAGHPHRFGSGVNGPEVAIRLSGIRTPTRIAVDPALGAAEAWMDGRLTVEGGDIEHLLELIALNSRWSDDNKAAGLLRNTARIDRLLYQVNRPRLAKRNVAHHYDLSDRLYDLFLDADRQYSCAYFREGVEDLETAQADKKAHIAAKLALKPGQSVLDIGCGWGGMALYLAQVEDVRVTGITLSEEQLKVARSRAQRAGLSDRVSFELADYRELGGTFDRIVSVGMFEHVGQPQYRTYFRRIRELMAEDGVALMHTIARAGGPGSTDSFTRKYIFPGGYSPALSEVVTPIEKEMLWITDVEVLRLHYAKTLDAWLRRTRFARDEIERMYDPRFYRMWLFYLAGSKFAFQYGDHMNVQVQVARRRDSLPLTRDYMVETEARYRAMDVRIA